MVSAALSALSAADPSVTVLANVDSTALGCRLIAGTPLTTSIDVYRLEFPLDDEPFAIHVTAEGGIVQPCDDRFPNLGAGTVPVGRARRDSDGDGLDDSLDACPQVAGLPAWERAGCPYISSADRDGDGTPDMRDHCPLQAGAAAAHGCALMGDEDGDGVPDHVDVCPAEFGVIRPDFVRGCPADGSGSSPQQRKADDVCRTVGDAPIYADHADDAELIGNLTHWPDRSIIGRTAAKDWVQLANGWVRAGDVLLSGACYNIPLVNPAPGGATGCFMRARAEFANVRQAPGGAQVARITKAINVAALGRNFNADWLFYRGGWVNRAVLELSGNCDNLPVLEPAKVASGVIHFCAPDYPGLLPPRIDIGERNAQVASHTIANRLRAAPAITAELIGEIPPRTVLDAVLDGPACNGPHIWWLVDAGDLIGWTVESDVNANYYYLEPVADGGSAGRSERGFLDRKPAEEAQPGANRIIHSANAKALDTIKRLNIESPQSVAWSPDGTELAVVSGSGSVTRHGYPDLAPLPFGAHSGAATAVAYRPDWQALAVGRADGSVIIADLRDDQPTAAALGLDKQAGPIRALAWTRAGEMLAAVSGDEGLKLARQSGTLKLWALNTASPARRRLVLHYIFPYPLSAVAFSADDRLLAVTGESTADRRASLWIYRAEDGELLYSKALVPSGGAARVLASPDAALGDFVYSSGDSLYQINVGSGEDIRFYHQAGMLITHFAFRRQVIPDAEALIATMTIARNGDADLRLANALNTYSPAVSFNVAPSAIAFSPDGRALAIAEPAKDRVLILGVTQH